VSTNGSLRKHAARHSRGHVLTTDETRGHRVGAFGFSVECDSRNHFRQKWNAHSNSEMSFRFHFVRELRGVISARGDSWKIKEAAMWKDAEGVRRSRTAKHTSPLLLEMLSRSRIGSMKRPWRYTRRESNIVPIQLSVLLLSSFFVARPSTWPAAGASAISLFCSTALCS